MKKPLAIILAALMLGGVIGFAASRHPFTDAEGRSCFHKGYDLFIATCNDSTGKDMTATFWTLLEETP